MKKKSYISPKTYTVLLKGPALMLQGSNTVNDFGNEEEFIIGDPDD
jgi:hypothetical protein